MPFVRVGVIQDLHDIEAFDQFHEVTADLLRSGACIVAGFDDAIFAYAIITRNFFRRRFVEYLFVHPDQRRKGFAAVLLSFAESQTPDEALWVSTALGNFPMQNVLNRLGYKHSGVVHDLTPLPELIFHKPAKNPSTP